MKKPSNSGYSWSNIKRGTAFLLLFLLITSRIGCDLPPNCIHGDVIGIWRIHVGTFNPCERIQEFEDPTCGFPSPDRDNAHGSLTPSESGLLNKSFKLSFTFDVEFKESELKILSVQKLDAVRSAGFDDFEKVGTLGNWTVILDQGFTFWTKSHRYTAFFKYLNEAEEINASYSFCHTTLLGWWDSYPEHQERASGMKKSILSLEERHKLGNFPWLIMKHDLDIRRGCWYGLRIMDGNRRLTDRSEWTLKVPRWRSSPLGLPPDHPMNAQNPTVAEYLSEISSGYSDFENQYSLWKRSEKLEIENRGNLDTLPKIRKALKISPHYAHRKKSKEEYITEISRVRESDQNGKGSDKSTKAGVHGQKEIWMRIKSFDWSNPDHVYGRIGKRVGIVPRAYYQGDCGNCFAVTAATIMTTRLWIKYSENQEIFSRLNVSPIQMTECNVYNQGCAGGLITLAFKFAQDVGVRTQECIQDYGKHLGVEKIYPNPVYIPDQATIADDGHSFLQAKARVGDQNREKEEGKEEGEGYDDGDNEGDDENGKEGQAESLEEMEEVVAKEGSGEAHISSSYDYFDAGDEGKEMGTSGQTEGGRSKHKFGLIEQLCWDLGGQIGAANTRCRMNIPITKDIPPSCSKLIRVKEYSYINNVYGKTTPNEIMKSLWNEGPVAVSLEPTLEFSIYDSGIFKGFYDPISRQYPWSGIPWYKVDHAMVITGWGWETINNERIPYWIVQNSWGRQWGEQGFCRIIRGVNELSIEHAAVRASVEIHENGKEFKETDLENLHDKLVFDFFD
ncbi:cathepsin CPC2 [Cryptosporidium felis]|nr:cathepsin CPC2 [Cryptosporidium felis]